MEVLHSDKENTWNFMSFPSVSAWRTRQSTTYKNMEPSSARYKPIYTATHDFKTASKSHLNFLEEDNVSMPQEETPFIFDSSHRTVFGHHSRPQ
jgi:hypothetical protein